MNPAAPFGFRLWHLSHAKMLEALLFAEIGDFKCLLLINFGQSGPSKHFSRQRLRLIRAADFPKIINGSREDAINTTKLK